MKEKIMNIKNILKIIISLFIIFNCVKSCSKAMTKSEAFEYCKTNSLYGTLFVTPQNDYNQLNISYDSFLTYLDNRSEQYYWVRMDSSYYNQKKFIIEYFDDITNVNDNGFTFITNETKTGTTKQFGNTWKWYQPNTVTTPKYTSGHTYNFPTGNNSFYMIYGNGQMLSASFRIRPTLQFSTGTDYITVNVNNTTIQNVIRTRLISTLEDPIWRNN